MNPFQKIHQETLKRHITDSPQSSLHTIEGEECWVILRDHSWKEQESFGFEVGHETKVLLIVKEDLGFIPSRGVEFEVDGEFFQIFDHNDHYLHWQIHLARRTL